MISGFLNLDKPLGLTSNDALIKAKRMLQIGKKAGHAGTLDPLASGVLPIAFNEATKVLPFIFDADKEYEFTVRWGIATTTDDMEGEIVDEQTSRPADEYILKILPQFTGNIEQIPPIYSAIKINGQRAYDLARAGQTPEMKSRIVVIHKLEYLGCAQYEAFSCAHPLIGSSAHFRVTCGKGTYIRALARDMARALGTVGHLTALRRTRVGPFHAANAISLDKLAELGHMGAAEAIQPIATALDDIPALAVTPDSLHRLRQGQPVTVAIPLSDGTVCQITEGAMALGIGVFKNGMLWPRRLFNL